MLWYKAWLETRSRFIIALVGCTALCVEWRFEFSKLTAPYAEAKSLFYLLHGIHEVLAFVWILSIILMMMGGLVQEQNTGTSSYTLALPVSRFRLMSVRIFMGMVQAFMLALIPWVVEFLASGAVSKNYPVSQMFFHVFLLWSGGIVFLAVALLISSIIDGQYTAPIVSIGIVVLLINSLKAERLNPYSPWTFMVGADYFQRRTGLLAGQFPIVHAAAFCSVAVLLFWASIKITQRRDF